MSTKELIHYRKEPIPPLKPIDIDALTEALYKPRGLWVSVEDGWGWKDWCTAEEFNLDHLAYEYKVTVKKEANILYLNNPQEIIDFGHQYADQEYNLREIYLKYMPTSIMFLKWKEVMQKYQGIIISPYQWDCRLRLETSWYNGWDCSSGCIWDINAIYDITQKAE